MGHQMCVSSVWNCYTSIIHDIMSQKFYDQFFYSIGWLIYVAPFASANNFCAVSAFITFQLPSKRISFLSNKIKFLNLMWWY